MGLLLCPERVMSLDSKGSQGPLWSARSLFIVELINREIEALYRGPFEQCLC
jgi:hypothetical protein